MKLYSYDAAPNPQRLGLFMKYKGIDIETQQVDLMSGEQCGDAYRAIVPECTVPALVLEDGTRMTEVIGICSYLEELYPEKPLMGTTALERAQVLSWDHKLFYTVVTAVADVLRNGSPNFSDRALPGPLNVPQIPELVERGRLLLEHAWEVLEEEAPAEGWLLGDQFSFADINMMVVAGFAGWVKMTPPESCARLHAYLGRVNAELN